MKWLFIFIHLMMLNTLCISVSGQSVVNTVPNHATFKYSLLPAYFQSGLEFQTVYLQRKKSINADGTIIGIGTYSPNNVINNTNNLLDGVNANTVNFILDDYFFENATDKYISLLSFTSMGAPYSTGSGNLFSYNTINNFQVFSQIPNWSGVKQLGKYFNYNLVSSVTKTSVLSHADISPEIMINIPRTTINLLSPEQLNCTEDIIRMSVPISNIDNANLMYEWKYKIAVTDFLSDTNFTEYKTFKTINAIDSIRFSFNDIPEIKNKLSSQTSALKINIAVLIKTTFDSSYSVKPKLVTILPAAPVIQSVVSSASCPNSNTGQININGISGGSGSYKYFIRNGHNNTEPCDPNTAGGCLNVVDNGNIVGGDKQLNNIAPGNYTLWIANNGIEYGACATKQNITINKIDNLTWGTITSKNIHCAGGSDGDISGSVSGGIAPFTFSLNSSFQNNSGQFINLNAGNYSFNVTDGCSQLVSPQSITLVEPPPLTVYTNTTNAACGNPASGSVTVSVNESPGSYYYKLYNANNVLMLEKNNTPLSEWIVEGLPAGSYTVKVYRANELDCAPATKSFLIASSEALSLQITTHKNIQCYGETSGSLSFAASGGMENGYRFFIKNTATNKTIESADGNFSNLPAATYNAWVMNADVSCNDIGYYSADIVLTSTTALNISSTSFPVSCNSQTDGKIETIVSGGASGYQYTWEEYDEAGGAWFTRFDQNGSTCINLSSGKYRFKVTDNNTCVKYSSEIIVAEPAELLLTVNSIKDIVCFGDNGSANMAASGGNGSYIFQRKLINALQWENCTNATVYAAGAYTLRVKDVKECIAEHDEVITYTDPTEKLRMIVELSDYNGYNVSCNGNKNARININATGGNGDNYDGYLYSFNKSAFEITNQFTSGSGSFKVAVKDARGCIDSSNVVLTQPSAQFNTSIVKQQNNNCAADSTGYIIVQSVNQVGSVKYRLGNDELMSDTKFVDLKAGFYTMVSVDDNACTDTVHFTITDLHQPIQYDATIQHVKCFGDSTGSINVLTSGGAGNYTYIWDDTLNGTSLLTNLPKSTHQLIIQDSFGCTIQTDRFIVSQPDAPLAFSYVDWKDIKCFGDAGIVLTSAIGGSGSKSFSYLEATTNDVRSFQPGITPFQPGEYSIEVMDSSFCKAVYPQKITFTSPQQKLQFNANLSDYNGLNISCYGANNGYIHTTPIGGNMGSYNGYWFSVNDGNWLKYDQTKKYFEFDSLKAGLFKISIKDARECIFNDTFKLTQADNSINIELKNKQNNLCADSSKGFFEIITTNSIHPVLYSIDSGITFQQSNIFEKLFSKKYQIKTLDANGCSKNKLDSIIDLNGPIKLSTKVQPILCYGSNSGAIIALVEGGSKPYKVSWLDSSIKSITDTAKFLSAGMYHLMASDQFGCASLVESVKLDNPNELIINSIEVPEIVCFEDSVIPKINTIGGIGKYHYWYKSIYLNDWLPLFMESNVEVNTKLAAGTYQIKVIDDNNCSYLYPSIITIQTPDKPLVFNLSAKKYNSYNVSCFGNNNGQIITTASGGNGGKYSGYYYSLNGILFDTIGIFNDLYSGTYSITVKDGRGCVVKKTIDLVQPDATMFLDTIAVVHNNCFNGKQGSVSLTTKYGMPPYSYNVNNNEFQSDTVFNQLSSGNNLFKVRDANGCGQVLSVAINNLLPKITMEIKSTDNLCNSQHQGAIIVNAFGGSGSYKYHWLNLNNSLSANMVNDLKAGKYYVQVSDKLGCYSDTTLIQIKEPDSLKIIQAIAADPICFNDSVTAVVSTVGGNSQYHYLYRKHDTQNWHTFYPDLINQSPTKFSAGRYHLKVLDANNCESTIFDSLVVVNPPQPLNVQYQLKDYNGFNVACYNAHNGTVVLNGSGGNGSIYKNYYFSLNGTDFSNNNIFNNLAAGMYQVKIKDGRGCVISKDITLSQPPYYIEPDTLLLTHNQCIKGNKGEIYFTAKNGVAPYLYALNDDKNYQSFGSFNNLFSSQYNLFIKDKNGCSQTVKVTIKDVNQPLLSNSLIQNVSCFGQNDGKINLAPSGGVPPYTFNWLAPINNSSNQLTGLKPSTYAVWITDSQNCLFKDSFVVTQPAASLSSSIYTKPVCTNNPFGIISFNPIGGTSPYKYSIDKGITWNAVAVFDHVKVGNYPLSVRDVNGCLWDSSTYVINNSIYPAVNFLISTDQQAKDTLLVKEICIPKADSIRWIFDSRAIVAKEDPLAPILQFNNSGAFYIGMKAWYKGCDFNENKFVNIQPESSLVNYGKGIDQLIASPNPNNGVFNLRIKLFKPQRIHATIYDLSGKLLWNKKWQNTDQVQEQVNISNLLNTGILLLKVITEEDARDVQLIIAK
jgi:hypothetical protein